MSWNNAAPSDKPASPSRGRPTGDHAARRAELLAAATRVIGTVGLPGASLRKVAQEAGCTTGAVTYYFSDRDELLLALSENAFNTYDAMLDSIRDTADVRSLMEQWLSATTEDVHYWPVMSQMLTHAQHAPRLGAMIAERYERYRSIYTEILEKAQADGTIRDDVPAELLADQLTAIGDGWTLMLRIDPERFDTARISALVDAAIALVRPRAA